MGSRSFLKFGNKSRRSSVAKGRKKLDIRSRLARFESLESRTLLTVTLSGVPNWIAQGPGPIGNGNTVVLPSGQNNQQAAGVESIAVDPNNASQIIIGTANGGAWRTTNANPSSPTAITWTPLTDQLGSLAIGAVAYDPSDTSGNTFYAGTGQFSEGFEGGPSVGLYKTTNAGTTWTLLGSNASGANILAGNRIKSIVVIGSTVLVGAIGNGGANYSAAGGGLFISTNSGATWTQDVGTGSGNLPAGPVTSLIQDPNNAQRVYAAVVGQGIFRNDSAGAAGSWVAVNTGLAPLGTSTEDIELSAQNIGGSTTLFAGISGEGSITNATNASPIVITAANNGLVNGDQVYISGVGGNTAANSTNNTYIPIAGASSNSFSLVGTTGNGAYTSGGSWESFNVFASTNNGGSWTQLANFAAAQQFFAGDTNFNEKFQVQADPVNAGVVYIDGEGVDFSPRTYRYNPSGSGSWVAINYSGASGGTSPHPDSRDMKFIGNTVLLESDDGGIYEMQNPTNASANTWNSFNGNLDATEIYEVAYDQKQQTIAAGVQDNGSPQQSSQGNATWTDQTGGDGQYQAVDATSSEAGTGSLHYALSDELQFFKRITYSSAGTFVSSTQVGLRSSFGAANFSGLATLDQNLAKSSGFNFTPFAVNNVEAGGPGMMLLGSNGLYEDNGTNRVSGQLAGDVIAELTTETGPATSPTIALSGTTLTGQFSALAYGGTFGGSAFTNVAVVGTNSGQLFFRGQTGSTFTNVAASLVGSGGITSIALDQQDWRHVYVIQGNKVETTADITNLAANPFRVIGGGASDNLLAATGQPGAPALSSVAIADVGTTPVPLVGAFGGVYRLLPSAPSANTWTSYGQGLPNAIASSVVYSAANDVLVVGTFGRGAWTITNASTTLLSSGVLNITGDQDYANENDTFRLVRDPTNNALLDVYINGTLNGPYQLAGISQINVNGEGGNNTLIVDSSNGLINVPNGIQYNGGSGGTGGFNTLQLDQPTSTTVQTSDTYSVGPNNGQGTDVIAGTGGTQTVYFQNLVPVTDNVPATTVTVNATPAANAINYAAGPGGGIFTGNTGIVTVDNQESYEFNNKTSLVINGLAGSDQINLNDATTPAGLTGSISVNGGDPTAAGDTLIVNGVAGSTDALVYSPTAVGAGSVADGTIQPQVNFTGMENVSIVGQDADGDTLAFNAPATAGLGTVVTYNPGSTSDSGTISAIENASGPALVPLGFTGFSTGGITFTDASSADKGDDELVVNGSLGNDAFNAVTDTISLYNLGGPNGSPTLTTTSAIGTLKLHSAGGAQTYFNLTGPLPYASTVIDGAGVSQASLSAPSGAVTVALGDGSASSDGFTKIAGYGGSVTLINVNLADLDLAGKALTVNGTALNNQLTYTPTGAAAGTLQSAGLGTVFDFTTATSTLTVDPTGGAASTGTVTVDGAAGSDTITVQNGQIIPADTEVAVNSLLPIQIVTADTAGLAVAGGTGNDVLEVFSTFVPVTIPITYDGGTGTDALFLSSGGPNGLAAVTDTYTPGSQFGSGSDVLTFASGSNPPTESIYFQNLAPVFDLVPGPIAVNGTNAVNAINYSEGFSNLTNFLAGTLSPTWGQVSVDSYEPIEFINKTTLAINGLAGGDQFNLNNSNTPTGLTSITVNGGVTSTGDTLTVNGTTGVDAIGFNPTGAEAGSVTVNSLPTVSFTAIENVIVNGQGGGDALTVTTPAGAQAVALTPGALPDEGQIALRNSTGAGNPLAGLSFTNLGASGSLTIADAGGTRVDALTITGTDASNQFNVSATGDVALNSFAAGTTSESLVTVHTPGVASLTLVGLGGNNVFNAAGAIPFTGGLFLDGNVSSSGDTANLTAATGAVAVSLANSAAANSLTSITGYGATVTLDGITVANLALAGNTLAVTANAPDDTVTYTPTGPAAGSFQDAGQSTVFNFTAATGAAAGFTINGAADISNTVVLAGVNGRDKFILDASLRTASITPVTALWQPVTLGAGVQILTAEGGSGQDTFQVTPAAGTQFAATGNLDNLLINVDGGTGGNNALVVQASGGGALAANQFVVVNRDQSLNSGTVRTFTAAVQWPDINYQNVQIVSPNVAVVGNRPNLLIMGPDVYEPNNFQATSAFLGSGATLQLLNAAIFPNSSEFPGVPADQDYYRVVAQTTGTLDFQVYFTVYSTALLPAGGELNLQVLDSAGDVIGAAPGVFGAQGTTANARVRIPAVAGQSYYLRVFGATAAVVNGYNATIIDTPPPVPYDLELARRAMTAAVLFGGSGYTSAPTVTIASADGPGSGAVGTAQIANGAVTSITISGGTGYDTPPTIAILGGGGSGAFALANITDTGDEPPYTPNSDSGRSQFDNVTNVSEPTIFIRLADGGLLNDLPGNGISDTPPAGVIPIPYSLPGATPGFDVAIFDGDNTQTPVGFATPVGPPFPGLYEYTFATQLADGVHNIVAEVQMIDPAIPTETGFGGQSTSLPITVDTVPPPVAFGTPGVANSGLAAGSDSGVQSFPSTTGDDITNVAAPTFYGVAEANAVVRVYALVNTSTVNISTATQTGTTVTIATVTDPGFSVGSQVIIAGVGVTGYNGTFTITSESPAGFTYTDANPGLAPATGGTATSVPTAPAPQSYVLLGTTTAIPIDGTDAYPNGSWSLTSTVDLNNPLFFAHDGLRNIIVTAEDLAGNISDTRTEVNLNPNQQLNIDLDTQGPQVSDVHIAGVATATYNLFSSKASPKSPAAIASATEVGNTVTITTTFAHGLSAGTPVTISGVGVAGYNGVFTITSVPSSTSFTYTASSTGLAASGGGSVVSALVGNTTEPTPLVNALDVDFIDQPALLAGFLHDAIFLPGAPAPLSSQGLTSWTLPAGDFQVVGDSNGIIPIKSITFYPTQVVAGLPARGYVDLLFYTPLPDDRYTLTVTDGITDIAGNKLDGESNAAEPNGGPTFPSGNGKPGGNFVARFTVNSRPHIGTWSGGNTWMDTNGNMTWDPNNTDASNRDLSYAIGYASDKDFAGNFAVPTALNGPYATVVVNGFDKLSAYGLVNNSYRWLIENDAGVPIISYTNPNQINGQPVAGDWNPTGTAPAGHDEVGLFDGTNWDLYTGGLYGDGFGGTLTKVPVWQPGYPIVGNFDGSGHISLATYNINTETFYFQLWSSATKTWSIHQSIYVGGEGIQLGVNTRPVAADLDQDGITDIGLYTPVSTGGTSNSPSDWYFWVSNDPATNTAGLPLAQKRIIGQVNTLNHPFSETPLGHDIFAQMGNNYALPIVGLFDPPIGGTQTTPTPTPTPTPIPTPPPAPPPSNLKVTLAGTAGNDTFVFGRGSAANTWSITLDGVTKTYSATSIIVSYNGEGGNDTATVHGSGANQNVALSPGMGTISGPGYSLQLLSRSITVDAGGGSGQASFSGAVLASNAFTASPSSATMTTTPAAGIIYKNAATGFQQVTATGTLSVTDRATISDGGIASSLTASGHTAKLSSLNTKATDYVLSLFNFGGAVTAILENKATVKSIGPTGFKLTIET